MCIDRIAIAVCKPTAIIGRDLFAALEDLVEAHDLLQNELFEVGRFVPPDGPLKDGSGHLVKLQQVVFAIVSSVIACLEEGLDILRWDQAVELLVERDLLVEKLIDLATRDLDDSDDQRLQRGVGLKAGELPDGSGFTFPSRLRVVWTKRMRELDANLYNRVPHLIEPGQELSFDVRHHLAALLATTHVLLAHRAAMFSRDLTLTALRADPGGCSDIIAELVNEESQHYATHRQVQKGVANFNTAQNAEDRMDPSCELYQRVMEGDIRRISRRVLGLLGDRQDGNATLKTIEDRLTAHLPEPGCEILLACINRQWRNAIAHSQFHWDTVNQCISLDGELAMPEDVARAAIVAFEVSAGFNAGVELALNEFDKTSYLQPKPVDTLVYDMQIERRLGESGIELLAVRRYGRTIQLDVKPLSLENFRDHLIGVLLAQHNVPQVDAWEVRQAGRPDVVLGKSALDAAESLVESDLDGKPFLHPHAVELVLYAEASRNYGRPAKRVARDVLCLSSVIILGEYNLFRRSADKIAVADEMAATISRQVRGIRKAATLLPKTSRISMVEHSRLLGEQSRSLHETGPKSLPRVVKFSQMITMKGMMQFPWLDL